jgi:ribosomal protein S18 acetylase RimI-like enzyme
MQQRLVNKVESVCLASPIKWATMSMRCWLLSFWLFEACQAWTIHRASLRGPPSFKLSSSSSDTTAIEVTALNEATSCGFTLKECAQFMVDNFWLDPHRLLSSSSTDSTSINNPSASLRATLLDIQLADWETRFGELLGSRQLPANLFVAHSPTSPHDIVGLVGLEVLLYHQEDSDFWTQANSASKLQQAVASLGPKQRLQYKGATVTQLTEELLPPYFKAVVCLSNLCVDPRVRRQGIASRLCRAVEDTTRQWGFTEVYLKVEQDNPSALTLYKDVLGYVEIGQLVDSAAIRVDIHAGTFVTQPVESLILSKQL